MLLEDPRLQGTTPAAWLTSAFRATPEGFDPTRFKLVVDEMDTTLACVTDRYTLVQNRELIAAFDHAADTLGVAIEVQEGVYKNGRSWYKFTLPDLRMSPDGDQSETVANVVLKNDYRGMGGLGVMAGWFRLICSNGMVVGSVAHHNLMRHTGEIDLGKFTMDAVTGVLDEWQVNKVLADTLAAAPVPIYAMPSIAKGRAGKEFFDAMGVRLRDEDMGVSLVRSIIEDTPWKYAPTLATAVKDYGEELGDNHWAMAQAVCDVSTHHMRGAAADDWATRQLRRIEQSAKMAA